MCLRPKPRWRLTRPDKLFENSKRASAMCARNMRASVTGRPRKTKEGRKLGRSDEPVPLCAQVPGGRSVTTNATTAESDSRA